MNTGGRSLCLVLILAGPMPAQDRAPAAGGWRSLTVTAAVTANWVENLSRTSADLNRKDATTFEFSLSASRHQQLTANWLLHVGADAQALSVPDYDRTQQITAGPQLGLQRKFGLGPLAAILQFDTALTYKSARLPADRGWTAEAGLRLAKRFTSAFKAGLRGHWLEHSARSATFDLRQHSFSVDATWDLSEQWSISGSAGRLSGDVVANAAPSVWSQALGGGLGPVVSAYYNSRPWEVTQLYGSGWVSYNVEANVDLWTLAASYAVTDHLTAEFRYSSAFVVNKANVRYPTDSWGLSLGHRF